MNECVESQFSSHYNLDILLDYLIKYCFIVLEIGERLLKYLPTVEEGCSVVL